MTSQCAAHSWSVALCTTKPLHEESVPQFEKLVLHPLPLPTQSQLVHVRLPSPPRALSHRQVFPRQPEIFRMQSRQVSVRPSMFVRHVLLQSVMSGEPHGCPLMGVHIERQ